MEKKTINVEVLIQNKRYTLCSDKDEAYVQRMVSYLNQKYDILKLENSYNRLNSSDRTLLLELSLAEDCIKASDWQKEQNEKNRQSQSEIQKLKHDLISLQTRNEELEKRLQMEKFAKSEQEKKCIRLETELLERGLLDKNK